MGSTRPSRLTRRRLAAVRLSESMGPGQSDEHQRAWEETYRMHWGPEAQKPVWALERVFGATTTTRLKGR
jgi:hypothetical protein